MKPGRPKCVLLCPKCIKTRLRASIDFKKFFGVVPPDPHLRERREGAVVVLRGGLRKPPTATEAPKKTKGLGGGLFELHRTVLKPHIGSYICLMTDQLC
jgi:hypothetical protein